MQFFFFIPYSLIFIVLFVMMLFGAATVECVVKFILKWQYVVMTVMFIIQLIITIGEVAESYLHMAFKIIYCIISVILDLIKQLVSMVLIMVFMLEIINDFNKHSGFIFFAIIYFALLVFIIIACMLVCILIPALGESICEVIKNETAAYTVLLILNIILTAIYVPICMWLIKADSSEYLQLFGKSIINNIFQVFQNVINFAVHIL